MPPEPDDAPLPWRAHWPAVALAVAGALVALWSKAVVFPHLSWNRDEPVYLWQMEVLRSGRLAAPDGGHPDLFLPWLSAARDGELFGQYTIGWPLVLLVARVLTGSTAPALALGAALAVAGTYALAYELLRRRAVAVAAGGLLLASPIFAIQAGVHLTYLFTLGLGLLFGALLRSGLRRQRPGRLVAAGVLLGGVFLTRPYDAVVWGGVFAAWSLLEHRARWRPVVPRLVVVGAGALPLVAVGLWVNHRLTGSPVEFAMTVKDPLDTFGFGQRRLMPSFEPVDYTPYQALRSSAKNGFVFAWFLAGSYLTVALAVAAVWVERRRPATWLLVALGVAFPVVYLPFWGTYLSSLASRVSGPIYLVPLYAPVCILVAALLVRWRPQRPRLVAGLVAALVVVTVPLSWNRVSLNRQISRSQAPWRTSLEAVEDPSIVLVADSSYVLFANPFGANPPELDGPRLFAAHGDPEVLDLLAAHPHRRAYVQRADRPSAEIGPREDPVDLDVEVVPATVHRGPTLSIAVDASVPLGAAGARVTVDTGVAARSWDLEGPGAARRVEVPVGRDGLDLAERGRLVVALDWDGGAPDLRLVLLYRVVDGVAEVLEPALVEQHVTFEDGRTEWWHHPPTGLLTAAVVTSGA
ncbi:MAG TPA: hypothetical protein VK007_01640 [Acidimicrobiales bacterium]|nr:hypothetical protein [Acidimicrobiales bacterium]